MILDTIANANTYAGLNARVDAALTAMQTYTPEHFPEGRLELDGGNLFLLFNRYDTHSVEGALSEAHRKHIDVMYMVDGEETIYVKPTAQLNYITQGYSADADALLAQTDSDAMPVRLTAGSFIVLFPQDAHTPACDTDRSHSVKKIIAKVAL